MTSIQKKLIATGGFIGLMASLLMKYGNPGNMGICVACFIRDIAGAMGLHSVEKLSYLRPEIIGFILGSFLAALAFKEFKPRGGSSPAIRFVLGMIMMIGALAFLGCPLRMLLRMAGGDLNALVGLAGFLAGIYIGILYLKKGFSLGRSYTQHAVNGSVLPIIGVFLLIGLLAAPAFIGSGAAHAPWILALAVGLAVGAAAQRTRLCTAGAFRDIMLIRDFTLFFGVAAIFITALVGNLIFNPGVFHLSFVEQAAAHTDGLWNFMGMVVVGFAATLLGGCPLRQTILGSEGDSDSAVTFLGLLMGAAVSHNFGLAASGAGLALNGQVGVIVCLVLLFLIATLYSRETA